MNMDRAIFDLNASVEATSLYILLCALLDQGSPPTLTLAREKWNGTTESLVKAAEELLERGVLDVAPPFNDDEHLHPCPRDRWR
ncbi:MAG: hypothetical protein HPY84_08435 [Syntrophobacteraceae bacterium]|nr:hypothetical protein [Syntrophobacteraceae bacterium]